MLPSATSLEGQKVPHVTLKTRAQSAWMDVRTAEFFKGRTVVVFGLPGAFTPTCSGSHLPRYIQLADALKANGVDEIVCVSVNDAFVMEAWGATQHAAKSTPQYAANVTLLPDGNGEFTAGLGLLVDKSAIGFGKRSWRYSMLVKDGVIAKMFIEAEGDADPFEVSDADTMLHHLNPKAMASEPIVVFAKPGCPFCARAKAALVLHHRPFDEISFGADVTATTLRAVSGKSTWPQVFVGGKHIGGADELDAYLATTGKG